MKQADRAVSYIFDKGLSVSVAESCTGGMIASELVGYSGISSYFGEGYVCYSNEAKMKNLGVREYTLKKHGAVSRETAAEMALGVKKRSGSDIGISTTGIAGPSGGSSDKPVGLCFIGCAYKDKVVVRRFVFSGSRYRVRISAVKEAFALLCDAIDMASEDKV